MSSFSQKQAQETGMAISFIVFAVIFIKGSYELLPVGLFILGLCLFWPYGFRLLFAPVWMVLTGIIGPLVSHALLIGCFFFLITPIGFIRRLTGSDPLQMSKWKKGYPSVFKVRNQTIQSHNIEKPF